MCTSHQGSTPTLDVPFDAAGLDDKIFQASISTLELFGLYLGDRLELYTTLLEIQPATPAELARAAGTDARYMREWLEQQAVSGYLTVDDPTCDAESRQFRVPDDHVATLTNPSDERHVTPLGRMVVGVAQALHDVVEAYRTGDGVPYERYGADFRDGQGSVNRPAFESALVESWLPAVPGLESKLANGARLADVGCGQGYSTVAIARQWPTASVLGVDNDRASIADSRAFAHREGVAAQFAMVDGVALGELGTFDVVTLLECVHDMSHPVEALRSARQALTEDGVVVMADELVADSFAAPGDEIERMMYGWSISHCLPASRTEHNSAALGTVLRSGTVRELAQQAGFSSVEVVDVDGGLFRIYALRA